MTEYKGLVAQAEIEVNAPVEDVWEALTTPEIIKQYFFGTEVETDWKPGSPIFWRGEYQGTKYEDKGEIRQVIPHELIEFTYWSSMGGVPDVPENYKTVAFHLSETPEGTKVTLEQDNNPTEENKKHSEGNWKMVLDGLKTVVEQQ